MQELARNLLIWYKENKRILPWRDVDNPYYTWLSEIMLQQTRVEAVKRYYERFLKALPTIEALANANEDVYLKLWEGLGYYSRVRNLHKAAIQIMEEYNGVMPSKYDEIIKLSGIGEYTASAISSISFGEKTPAIDGNLLRIYSRLTKCGLDIKSTNVKKEAHSFYLGMMDFAENDVKIKTMFPKTFGDLNQALMDLGAMICVPNGMPSCKGCPIGSQCMAKLTDTVTDYPIVSTKKSRTIEKKTILTIHDSGKIALSKRKARGLLAGMYEFPNVEGHLSLDEAIRQAQDFGFSPLTAKWQGESRHIFSHKEWHMIGYEIICDEFEPAKVDLEKHLNEENMREYIMSKEQCSTPIFLAKIADIEEKYSIPSAFSFYRKKL